MFADLWQRKGNGADCFKNGTFVVCHIKIFSKFSKGLKALCFDKPHYMNPFKMQKRFKYNTKSLPLKIYLILAFLENKRSACFEATTYLAFLCHKSATRGGGVTPIGGRSGIYVPLRIQG